MSELPWLVVEFLPTLFTLSNDLANDLQTFTMIWNFRALKALLVAATLTLPQAL